MTKHTPLAVKAATAAALLWAITLLPPQWFYEAGKWTRAAIGLPPIEAQND